MATFRAVPYTLDALARAFQDATLPKADWTHQAHLAVGTWYLCRYSPPEALDQLRTGIIALNRAHGVENTPTSGYHETITRAYVELLGQWCAAHPDATDSERVEALLASPLAAPRALFLFYTKERLLGAEARASWIEPDVAPLDLAPVGHGRAG